MAAPAVGIICGLFALVLILIYLMYEANKAKKKNVGFEVDEDTVKILQKTDEMLSLIHI